MSETPSDHCSELVLTGLSGGNLLGFLAALGAFHILSNTLPLSRFRMSWCMSGGAWRPVLSVASAVSEVSIIDAIEASLCRFRLAPESHPAMLWRGWLEKDGSVRETLDNHRRNACATMRETPDWLAAIGTEMPVAKNEDADSAFRAPRGDYFIGNLHSIISEASRDHIKKALFEAWRYDDPLDNLSLKFDASEDRRHALQWAAPSGDPDRRTRGNVLGANRLALEAIRLFPTALDGAHLATTGFTGRRSSRELTWCIWQAPISIETFRSVAALPLERPDTAALREIGISVVYRCRRETIGKTRIFTRPYPL